MNAEEDERIRNQQKGIIDAFIPNKRSNDGDRFGFVRYNSMDDSLRAIDRLDIFTIYNYKLRFYLVRNQYRRSLESNPDSSKSSFKKVESSEDLEEHIHVRSTKLNQSLKPHLRDCSIGSQSDQKKLETVIAEHGLLARGSRLMLGAKTLL
ncbi:hypothetical protein GQ457_12G009580 [Hibiscus cannabinus]